MLAFERHEGIKSELSKSKKVFVSELALSFNVTEETIRRDLEKMEKEGYCTRIYGGAFLNSHTNEEISYKTRNTLNQNEKQYIAQRVSHLVKDGDSLVVDSSSTGLAVIHELYKQKKNLTILTNSIEALRLGSTNDQQMISTGGSLRPFSFSLVGSEAIDALKKYNVDIAILGCKGIAIKTGVTESNSYDADVKKIMIKQANKLIIVADHEKFDQVALLNLIPLEKVDYLITDRKPSDDWLDFTREHQIELIY
ncbi:DeoR/GlpR family DNA-binding transcription regulator [Sporolactobacillus spathodeae]|uniref:DeoR/GlpR family transcriptional regulator of sugar metabolism n=1 Tax=Sporolactobacillus spathodeae TaxID=1465502 RepID=A0ABS2Q5L3_9BACL|nr:DeoR/GlpR family DNA-binding transcription regulator [Sporolactobacillus spathodeae]MBM7657079.1 DeoR/GlpR family transcriptional regulator of sugar metabolism [Sporolactobacillus spathodeae]